MMGAASKGRLSPGADADLVILSERKTATGATEVVIDEVWKLGAQLHVRGSVDMK